MAEPVIAVLAGTNGAGKSSVGGELIRAAGATFFNPDEVAKEIQAARPGLPLAEANSLAWHEGLSQLESAIALQRNHFFETTLGGNTITATLEAALDRGMQVKVWYVGLDSPERHIARVQARVARGGHAIPEEIIRARYDQSLRNLIRLLPRLDELKVFDNSAEADPHQGLIPTPVLVCHLLGRRILATDPDALTRTPEWAKPIMEMALRQQAPSPQAGSRPKRTK